MKALPDECQPRVQPYLHLPVYHIVGAMLRSPATGNIPWPLGCTDSNAVFQQDGMYHVMHQTPSRDHLPQHGLKDYRAAWGHVASRDLVHWRRLPDAIAPPPQGVHSYDSHDGDCDGWVSLPRHSGFNAPLLTFGPDCARGLSGANDAPRVAVARPANTSDPFLTKWQKDVSNPILFADGSPPCSFSGSVWRHAGDANYSMICAVNQLHNAWGRYTTSDASLHGPWDLADPSFATWHGAKNQSRTGLGSISAPSFVPLPPPRRADAPADAESSREDGAAAPAPTHMINALGGRGFYLGVYDEALKKLGVIGEIHLVESLDSPANWFVAGTADDGRVLHVGFIAPGNPNKFEDCYNWRPAAGDLCPVTSIRSLR